jgi:hypothetical protein
MQAGLTPKRLTLRDVFTSAPNFLRLAKTAFEFILQRNSTGRDGSAISMAA